MAQSEIGQETQNATQNAERYEKSKYKIPIFTDRNTEMNKTDPKMVGADTTIHRVDIRNRIRRSTGDRNITEQN